MAIAVWSFCKKREENGEEGEEVENEAHVYHPAHGVRHVRTFPVAHAGFLRFQAPISRNLLLVALDRNRASHLLDPRIFGERLSICLDYFADGGKRSRLDDHFNDVRLSAYVHDAEHLCKQGEDK